ncbi:MAG: ABC-F type ribosomal protection protein [Firmicutes bacterium]|nr:ABC-F type ribosomal protection protein [Bacillota bacterium]
MSLINIQKLTFAYEGSSDKIFDKVSFSIDTDWRLGFCGRNGRGKTTFLKLLKGDLEYNGVISKSVKFDYFPMEVKNEDNLVVEILNEVAPSAEIWQIQKEFSLLSIDEDILWRQYLTLSGGEKTKILLAGLFLNENNFLLIDEPTNHLDIVGREILAKYLKGKKGFILVSHDRAFLDECVSHILSINKENIEIISGNFSTWLREKEKRDAFEMAENRKLESEITRLKKASERTARWSDKVESSKFGSGPVDRGFVGAKSASMMKRSKAIEKRQNDSIEEKSKLLKNIERADSIKIETEKYFAERLISMADVAIIFGEKKVLKGFNISIERGQRIALEGVNGSGKSSVLKLIMGQKIPHSGNVNIGSRLKISFVPQDASHLKGNLRDYAREEGVDETHFRMLLHKLDFSENQFEKDMKDFSAGQKKKVLIAKSLAEKAHLYVWDEALNYVDILSRIQIEEMLIENKPTMIFVEHDKTFCEKVATEIVKISG